MNSQSRNVIGTNFPHRPVVSKKEEASFSTKKITFSVTRNAKSDAEKISYIYSWITQNISYDVELMRSEVLQKKIYTSEDNIIKSALDRKKAICGGFALLFKSMCSDVGIKAEVVNGFTKDYSGEATERKIPTHTWNVVKLKDGWHLLDITWAIGHGSENNPDNFWYFTNPQEFIYSHYPENPKWTLIKNPISYLDFQRN